MTDPDLEERVVRVIDAYRHNEALLDYLWRVMEGDDDGVSREEVVIGDFGGDVSLFERGHTLIQDSWRRTGMDVAPSNLISERSDGRLVMFSEARTVVFELLVTD